MKCSPFESGVVSPGRLLATRALLPGRGDAPVALPAEQCCPLPVRRSQPPDCCVSARRVSSLPGVAAAGMAARRWETRSAGLQRSRQPGPAGATPCSLPLLRAQGRSGSFVFHHPA